MQTHVLSLSCMSTRLNTTDLFHNQVKENGEITATLFDRYGNLVLNSA